MATKTAINDITRKVFEEFLLELTDSGVSAETIVRLRKALLEEGTLSESAIKAALSEEDQGQ